MDGPTFGYQIDVRDITSGPTTEGKYDLLKQLPTRIHNCQITITHSTVRPSDLLRTIF